MSDDIAGRAEAGLADPELDLVHADRLIRGLVDAVKAAPDRVFTDDLGRRWEWCGGQPGTWAWRVTGLRERVAAALRVQFPEWNAIVKHADTIASGLLSLPGYAVVELPEFDDARGTFPAAGYPVIGDNSDPGGMVRANLPTYMGPTQAREIAAALLAAANAAEDGCPPIPKWPVAGRGASPSAHDGGGGGPV